MLGQLMLAHLFNFVLLLPPVVHLLLLSLKAYFPGMGLLA